MSDCFHVHPYVRVLDGQAFTFFLRFVTPTPSFGR